jgi:pimeloyl-ACP methyl ester carboxylesterase/predicted glycosyltransferase
VKARQPDEAGRVERNGVGVHWERFGDGSPTILLAPTWSIAPSRHWKMQVPFLARHHRVLTFDGRGSGLSDRPVGPAAYTHYEFAADIGAVLDASGTDDAVLVALSCGTLWSIQFAADHPDRVIGLVAIGPAVPLAPGHPERQIHPFDEPIAETEGWAKYNRYYWQGDYRGFLEYFFGRMFSEPHSTKAIEDCVRWGLEIDPLTLTDTELGLASPTKESIGDACDRVRCPVLVIHGDEDAIRTHASGAALAERTGGRLVTIAGAGHGPHVRDPVVLNGLIKEFVDMLRPTPTSRTWVRAASRPKRALYLSSPIGLGHALRDVAIAQELRRLHPDLQIDWLAEHPVTRVLDDAGERIHPASAWLANESAHFVDEAAEHDLHAFQAIRRMDEILVNNFMVFNDVVRDEHYDLVIGDEAWDVDYFLHENPELKTFSFAWLTDFVGWLPMPDGGDEEAALAADYNAEMLEQRARFQRIRDRSIFVGDPDDIVPDSFGPDLPVIREWTEQHFEFAGYVTGFDPADFADREALRAELGYRPDDRVCVVTVGGSGVGESLLRRVLDAVPLVRRQVDGLHFVVVCGPNIDPSGLPRRRGVSYRQYVPQLYRHLAACDVAVVQGGLTTCMELTANRRPFVYVPLRHHFEQNFHVHHRLQRYGAGRRLDYDESVDPEMFAKVIADEVDRTVDYLPVETDGAARAAAVLAELV